MSDILAVIGYVLFGWVIGFIFGVKEAIQNERNPEFKGSVRYRASKERLEELLK